MPWKECLVDANGIKTGELFKFRAICIGAFQAEGFPKEAAVFTEAVFEESARFWISPVAVELLQKNSVDLSKWHAKDAPPPSWNEVAILAGHHELAWELLK